MKLHVRTLRLDGRMTQTIEDAPRYRKKSNALATIGSRLRAADPTVCACRADEITEAGVVPSWQWVGHYLPEHMDAINRAGNAW